jgi:antagonist of KipI
MSPGGVRLVRIVKPGVLSTVQDRGRADVARFGVSPSGAADWYSARAANRLVGNDDCAALVELTMTDAIFETLADTIVAVTGADGLLSIAAGPSRRWSTHLAVGGSRIEIGAAQRGFRSYVAFAGGVKVPLVLGSAATDVGGGFGGLQGRALRAGDELQLAPPHGDAVPYTYDDESIPAWPARTALRVLPGPHEGVLTAAARAALHATEYTVSSRSTRQGLQLDGAPLPGGAQTGVTSAGACAGCVQITSAGVPALLLAEHQTTGGYAAVACVIAADLPRAAQLQPGDRLHFELVSQVVAARAREEALRKLDEVPRARSRV